MLKANKKPDVYSLSYRSSDFRVGGTVAFRQTTGDYVSRIVYGTVLAIGAQRRDFGDDTEDGAIVAWEGYEDSHHPQWARVGFSPFWNQRLTAVVA